MINIIRLLVLLSLGIFIAIFSYQNMEPVEINFYQYTYKIPIFVLIFGCFIVGFAIPAIYYYFRNLSLNSELNSMQKIFNLYGKGNFSNLMNLLKKQVKNKPHLSALLSELYVKTGKVDEGIRFFETLRQSVNSSFVELALSRLYIKKNMYDEALMCLRQSISYDFKNLRAYRLLRDVSFLKGNLPEAIAVQRNILKIVEKEFSKREGIIMGNLLAYSSLYEKELRERERLVKEALRYVKNPLTVTAGILLNMEKGKEGHAQQLFEESFNNDFHNHVVAFLLNYKDKLPYFLNIIREKEGSFNLEILVRAYLELNVFEPLKERVEKLPVHLRAMVEAGESHVSKDKLCFDALKEVYKLWECKCCGASYKFYKPMCEKCFEWNCIDLITEGRN